MEIKLTNRVEWENLADVPDVSGVYVISKDSVGDVIYIGLTDGRGGLRKRLRTFNRAAHDGISKHAGGRTYHRTFGPDVSDLSVRVHPVTNFEYERELVKAWVAYVERRLIWEHIERVGALPVCNSM